MAGSLKGSTRADVKEAKALLEELASKGLRAR